MPYSPTRFRIKHLRCRSVRRDSNKAAPVLDMPGNSAASAGNGLVALPGGAAPMPAVVLLPDASGPQSVTVLLVTALLWAATVWVSTRRCAVQ